MKSFVLFSFLALFAAPLIAALNYPVQVQIIDVHWQGKHGYGHGNLEDGHGLKGFDFDYQWCNHFDPTKGPMLRARWTDNRFHRLALAMSPIGEDRLVECQLKVTQQNFIYGMKNGVVVVEPHGGNHAEHN